MTKAILVGAWLAIVLAFTSCRTVEDDDGLKPWEGDPPYPVPSWTNQPSVTP